MQLPSFLDDYRCQSEAEQKIYLLISHIGIPRSYNKPRHLNVTYALKMSSQQDEKRQAAREVIDILHEISILLVRLLSRSLPFFRSLSRQWEKKYSATHLPTDYLPTQNTHLDRTELSLCVSLIENGVNPEALAVSPRYFL
jgi:mitotic-spindle organizing protein 1